MPEPLLPNPFDPPSHEHTAYESCLNLETSGPWDLSSEPAAMYRFSPQVAARVLGYALIYHPGSSMAMSREISGCGDNAEFMAGLGYLYVMGVIRMFKGPVPTRRVQPESPPENIDITALSNLSQYTGSDTKRLVLARDNHRCILSGNVDATSLWNELTTIDLAAGERKADMELCYIFKMTGDENQGYIGGGLTDAARRKLRWASSAAAVLERLAGISVVQDIHEAENTFVISPNLHGPWDRLWISLHPIKSKQDDSSNTYEIHTYPPHENAEYGFPYQITLTDTTGRKTPLPSRAYFQLYDVCAKIAYLSGAGEVMERLVWEVGNARDGRDGGLLALALCLSRSE
ncbi:uncharacterized protein EV420DRAFT_1765587 [Desarmillaria tabescens]|uniref:HNH nuclease domain-containing protein n=1 Tax=Armillaria tabescens TaxID=1929756 RepID=A0AA39N297_ARMTA|nr:uncharacterized protein EV420DRAFT_1765587 [Desarmillaria tabescens]KAK0455551.1 hypothetical protein EV420DRAFT_1765587 [Desarmillaria tabescens]